MSELSKSYDPISVEEKWYSFWENGGFFVADPKSGKEPYCIVIPPPNVTGVLHMGHALVDTLQDILIRWKRMQGFEVLWVPGTDHAGIATQSVVEKNLRPKRRQDFSREEFLKHVWDWKEQSQEKILSQIKKLGCSCDWSRLRFTMDESLSKAVQATFKKMYDDGLIYRGDYLVNWDPVLQTALSDDEVEQEERESFMWHIRYPFADGSGEVVVATTRPETMLGDTAVAVHPEDKRYKASIGKEIRLPLTGRLVPIIADHFVDPEFGTGAVKLTPAHDFNDFEAGRRHNLPMINILTPDAKINCGEYAGLDVEEARVKVVAALKKEGFLVKVEPHTLRIGVSYRSKAVIQPYLSKQWFVRVTHFQEKLLSAVERVKFIPPHWVDTYKNWIVNLRDWCISRQLWWGHRIPIWYDKNNRENYVYSEVPVDGFEQDPDVLDTWFSSALWPFSVLGWPEKTDDLKKFYPTATLITGHDILFFWVARMIMMGEYIMDDVPFKETFLHGLIYGKSYWRMSPDGVAIYVSPEEKRKLDHEGSLPAGVFSKWEKMSKSKGNVIDPLQIIADYGTDALRMALTSSVTHARQIDLDLRRFEEFKNFTNKIWNGARFAFMHLEDLTKEEFAAGLDETLFTLEDRWILSVLDRTIAELNQNLADYHFDKAATRSYEFFWNDFCAVYIEASKPALFGKISQELRKNKQKLLVLLLSNAMRLMHPIAPFITEEIFSSMKEKFDGIAEFAAAACITAPYPSPLGKNDPLAEKDFECINELVRTVRNLRAEMAIPPHEKTDLYISGKDVKLAQENLALLFALTPTANIKFNESCFGTSQPVAGLELTIPIPESLKATERARLEKELEKARKYLESTQAKLANESFRARAPREVVANLERTAEQTSTQILDLEQKLKAL